MLLEVLKISCSEHSFSGFFVVVEGMNGVGKSTLVSTLNAKLIENGYESKSTRLPTDLIRNSTLYRDFVLENKKYNVDFEALQLLHIADRVQHSQKYISPLLKQGKIVLCDRYIYSTLVTMCIYNSVPFDWFFEIANRILKPDLTIVLDCSIRVCLERLSLRKNRRKTVILNDELQQGLELYKEIALSNGDTLLNTERLASEKITDMVFEQIKYRFKKG